MAIIGLKTCRPFADQSLVVSRTCSPRPCGGSKSPRTQSGTYMFVKVFEKDDLAKDPTWYNSPVAKLRENGAGHCS